MANKIELCNFALGNLSEQRINSLEDESEPARLCSLHLDQSVREVLRRGKWKAARTEAVLGKLANAPSFGWSNAFQLPNDFVRLVSLNDLEPEDMDVPTYEIRGDRLLTDEASASVVYVRDLTIEDGDINAMDALMTNAVVLNLASKMAWPLQQSRTLQENLELRFDRAIRQAMAADAVDERRKPTSQGRTSNWLGSRRVSTNG